MKKVSLLRGLILTLLASTLSAANFVEYRLSLPENYTEKELDSLFSEYCGPSERLSTEIPYPNYNNKLVREAVKKLNTVAPVSFYMYSAIIAGYGFKKVKDPSFPWDHYKDILSNPSNHSFGLPFDDGSKTPEFSEEILKSKFDYQYISDARPTPPGVNGNTHAFITYLCGEFRDRPTLIEDKLRWMAQLTKLPAQKQSPIEASKDLTHVFNLMSAESYAYFVTFSRQAFNDKEAKVWQDNRTFPLSEKWLVDKPVPAFSVCEVKYIMTEYISQLDDSQKLYPGFEAYQQGYADYEENFCSQEDKDYYYDFRGDSNMKPNSPESNAMIWYSTSIMNRCGRSDKGNVFVRTLVKDGKKEMLQFPIEECENYMKEPFSHRWNAARSGLATWLMRDRSLDYPFSNTGSNVSIVPHFLSSLWPAHFMLKDNDPEKIYESYDLSSFLPEFRKEYDSFWPQADMGFNSVFGLSPSGVSDINTAYERLKDSVDRHTDWYSSGYDDSYFEPERARVIGQAYSPFVASSYEMSESDGFTAPGLTVNGPSDGRKQWMFVFRVHKDRWYNTQSLAEGKPINFEWDWIDETSFGTTPLADKERAWDRLGTPLEGEMETILYLHNIESGYSAIKDLDPKDFPKVSDDGLGATE